MKMKRFKTLGLAVIVMLVAWFIAIPQASAAYYVKQVFVRIAGTAGETVTTGELVAIKDADGEWYKADADSATIRPAIGIVGSKTGGDGETIEVIIQGVLTGWSALAEGDPGYLSETAGEVTQSTPSYSQQVALALSTTDYYFDFKNFFDTSSLTALGVLTGASPIVLEGASVNAHDTTIAVTDPTGTRTVTLADASGTVMLSSLATNGPEAANSVTGASNAIVYEGSDDAHETSLSATDPTADNTITLPDDSGALAYEPGGGTTVDADALAIPVTHSYVAKTTGADAEALTLANGEDGQVLVISLVTDGNGDGTLTPTTCSGFATIVFADAGDTAALLYVDNTVGWVILGLTGVAAPPVITI